MTFLLAIGFSIIVGVVALIYFHLTDNKKPVTKSTEKPEDK